MSESNPWQFISSREVYDNPWIRVREDDVFNPGGGRSLYGWVSFKNQAVGVIPLDKSGNTWLVGQYRYTLSAYSWEIPSGGSPKDKVFWTRPGANSKRKPACPPSNGPLFSICIYPIL